ncbi:ROK family transcriptional regulator [Nocardioides donggukensis]|uniref:ROK family transcriptional regulator n=1 Tax=Nocardioides donggukensis TaxID=2774019 RepID=A0A927K6B6_9ACTN|nr:ROK family transcriptional regulator [Nocardioides donggukensis]MBD8870648.1 ROK family transcriptional regulator [Nocardioides donggukensis]
MRDADAPFVRVTTGTDQAALRRAHLGLVLRSLRDEGGRSRAQLAADLGLTRAVASGLVGELEARGLVCPGARQRGAVGRPGTTVELDAGLVCGLGAEVNVDHVSALAVDLGGDVVAERRVGLATRRLTPDEVLDELAAILRDTLAELTVGQGRHVAGVTVGVAGLVDAAHEVVTLAPNLGWRDLPVAQGLRDRLTSAPAPLSVDNEANLAASAEIDPADPDRSDMLVVFGEVGVGGGVVADGRLRRGRHGFAGEFGHMIVDPQGRPCACGRVGCWETVVGLRALLEAATDPDDPVRDPALTLEDRLAGLAERARRGDTRTLAALHEIGSWLGTGAAVLVNALDPGVVVLGGYFAALGQWLRPAVEEQLAAGVLASRLGETAVVVSTLGPTAAVRGAALASLEHVFLDPTAVPRRAETLNGAAR